SPRQVQAMAETAGVTHVVTKPATIDEGQGAVDAVLHRKHPAGDAASPETDEHRSRGREDSLPEFTGGAAGQPARGGGHPFPVLFERGLDAMLLLTPEGRCLEANPAAVEMLGRSQGELAKLSLWDLLPPEDVPGGHELWQRFLAAGRITARLFLLDVCGQRRE